MKKRLLLFALLALLLAGCAPAPPDPAQIDPDGFSIHFIDVGQADAILVLCDGAAMLVDGGNVADSSLLCSYLEAQGVTELSYMVCTHAHEDHVGGLSGPLNTVTVRHALCPVTEYDSDAFRDFKNYVEAQGLTIEVPQPNDTFSVGSADVTVLGPLYAYEETNNTSLVLRVAYGDTRFLLTGDMEQDAELDLLDAGVDLRADVLKVSHHGSSTSTCAAFYAAVSPSYAVISCGVDNEYGHPHWETMQTLSDTTLYRTDEAGTVVCRSDGTALTFETEKAYTPAAPVPVQYIGNRTTGTLHSATCGSLPAEKNREIFTSYAEAIAAGYHPHKSCLGG